MNPLWSCSYINQSGVNITSMYFKKTTKAVIVSNLMRNQCFYSIDEKHDDYNNNVNVPTHKKN
jgi:hypothetical protein